MKEGLSLTLNEDGWLISKGDRSLGPFPTLQDIHPISLAEELGVEPKRILELRMSVYSRGLRRIQSGSLGATTFQFESKTVEADFRHSIIRIHPSIDVKGGKAYIGVWIPSRVVQQPRRDGEDPKVTYRDLLYLISSDRELILTDDEALRERGLTLSYDPFRTFEDRWRNEDIEGYLAGNPAPEPSEIFRNIKERLEFYIEFQDPRFYTLIALWIIGTYFTVVFNSYPYLYIGGTKRTGKTKLLTLISCLAFNAIPSASISTASLYRAIQNSRGTLLLDETERLHEAERGTEFRAILLAGFKKGTYAVRCEGEEGKRKIPTQFEVYGPKAIANIQGIEDVLEDRCISITMLRALGPQKNREVDERDPTWSWIRDSLYRLFLSFYEEVRRQYEADNTPTGACGECGEEGEGPGKMPMESRELELWRPILALSDFLEKHGLKGLRGELTSLARDVARLRHIENITESADLILIQALRELVQIDDWYPLKRIREAFESIYGDIPPKWLSSEWVSRALRRLGFREKRRRGTGIEYRLTPEAVKGLLERLGLSPEPSPSTQPTQPGLIETPTQAKPHTPRPGYRCPHCDCWFVTQRDLEAHLTTHKSSRTEGTMGGLPSLSVAIGLLSKKRDEIEQREGIAPHIEELASALGWPRDLVERSVKAAHDLLFTTLDGRVHRR